MTRPTALFLSARYARREEILTYARRFEALGFTVTSRWLTSKQTVGAWHEYARYAQECIEDIERSDAFVAFGEDPQTSGYMTGGRHAEFGEARRLGLPLFLVGPREHVFHYLPVVTHFPDLESLFDHLVGLARPSKTLTHK